jgi:hypothetical protein
MTSENIPAINAFCRERKVLLLIGRCPVSNLEVMQAMERDGFLLMDTLIYYSHNLQELSALPSVYDIEIRPFKPDEMEDVRQLVRWCVCILGASFLPVTRSSR